MILDYSGSMRFSSLLGTPYYGDNRSCNNQDTVVPVFGQYSAGSATTGMPAAAAPPPMETRIFPSPRPTAVRRSYPTFTPTAAARQTAFSAAASSYATTPGGDVPCKSNSGTSASYAQTVGQVLNISNPGNSTYNSNFETKGYKGLRHDFRHARFPGIHARAGLLGQDVLLLAARSHERLAHRVFQFPDRKRRQLHAVG